MLSKLELKNVGKNILNYVRYNIWGIIQNNIWGNVVPNVEYNIRDESVIYIRTKVTNNFTNNIRSIIDVK